MSNLEFTVFESIPGAVGAFIEDLPLLTTAHVRPFVIAILLHRGAVRPSEVLASLTPHCRTDDVKVGAWDPLDNEWCDGTRAEKLVDEVLGELVGEGMLRYNEAEDLWVLTANQLPRIISWVTSLGARMPQHVLTEISKSEGTVKLSREQSQVVDDQYAQLYREGDRES
jgi:hypothetical protein